MTHSVTRPRRGLVSITMLIALIILGLVAANLLKASLARRTAATMEEHQLQAELLADSGVDRALARVEANPAYPGETWAIPAADLGGRGAGVVKIEIKPDPAGRRVIVVVADYLASQTHPVRQTRTIRSPLSPPAR